MTDCVSQRPSCSSSGSGTEVEPESGERAVVVPPPPENPQGALVPCHPVSYGGRRNNHLPSYLIQVQSPMRLLPDLLLLVHRSRSSLPRSHPHRSHKFLGLTLHLRMDKLGLLPFVKEFKITRNWTWRGDPARRAGRSILRRTISAPGRPRSCLQEMERSPRGTRGQSNAHSTLRSPAAGTADDDTFSRGLTFWRR